MDKFVIEGGHPLEGTITTCGSKNAVLPILAAGLLTSGRLRITNAPKLSDVDTMMQVLRDIECSAERNADGVIELQPGPKLVNVAGWDNADRRLDPGARHDTRTGHGGALYHP